MSASQILPYIPDTVYSLEADNLATLWKATDGTSAVAANGDVVKRWSDPSANLNHFTESTNPPAYHATAFNGRPCVQFDGAAGRRLTSTKNFTDAHNSAWTMTLAFQTASTTNLWVFGVNTATSPCAFFWRKESGWYAWNSNQGSPAFTKFVPATNRPVVMMVKYDGSNLYMSVSDSVIGRKYSTAAVGSVSDGTAIDGSMGLSGLPMLLGCYPTGAYPSQIDVAKFHCVGRCVTSAEEAEIMGYMCESLGIGTAPAVIVMGDSMTAGTTSDPTTAGAGDADSLFGKLRTLLGSTATVSANAYVGRFLYQARAEFDKEPMNLIYPRSSMRTIVPIYFGTNDAYYGADSALSQLWELCDLVAKRGGIPIPCTVLGRGDATAVSGGYEASRLAFNALIRAGYRAHAPAMIDYAAEPIMGLVETCEDTDYFKADKIHLTPAGNALLAAVAYPVISEAVLGKYDAAYPRPYVRRPGVRQF